MINIICSTITSNHHFGQGNSLQRLEEAKQTKSVQKCKKLIRIIAKNTMSIKMLWRLAEDKKEYMMRLVIEITNSQRNIATISLTKIQ
jgi:hypothetical protein